MMNIYIIIDFLDTSLNLFFFKSTLIKSMQNFERNHIITVYFKL